MFALAVLVEEHPLSSSNERIAGNPVDYVIRLADTIGIYYQWLRETGRCIYPSLESILSSTGTELIR